MTFLRAKFEGSRISGTILYILGIKPKGYFRFTYKVEILHEERSFSTFKGTNPKTVNF